MEAKKLCLPSATGPRWKRAGKRRLGGRGHLAKPGGAPGVRPGSGPDFGVASVGVAWRMEDGRRTTASPPARLAAGRLAAGWLAAGWLAAGWQLAELIR